MSGTKKVGLYVSIPKEYLYQMRKIVAEHNLKDPSDHPMTAAKLARIIICRHLDESSSEITAAPQNYT